MKKTDREKFKRAMFRACVARLWERADAAYGVDTRAEAARLRAEICARKMGRARRLAEICAPFEAWRKMSIRAPEIRDILGLYQRLARAGGESARAAEEGEREPREGRPEKTRQGRVRRQEGKKGHNAESRAGRELSRTGFADGRGADEKRHAKTAGERREQKRRGRAARKARRKAAGLCPGCGKARDDARFLYWELCRSNFNRYSKNKYQRRKAAGLCVRCGERAEEGNNYCAKCGPQESLKKKESKARFVARRKAAGLCLFCGRPARGKSRCEECNAKVLARRKAEYAAKVAAGLCPRCGGMREDMETRFCRSCRALAVKMRRDRDRKRYFAELCIYCGKNPRPEGQASCEECRARNRLRARKIYEKAKAATLAATQAARKN